MKETKFEFEYHLLDNYTINDLRDLALEIIDSEDFTVYRKDNGMLALKDNQGANWGDIEDREYEDLAQIIGDLEIYHHDYFEEDFVNCIGDKFGEEYSIDDIPFLLKRAEENMEDFADYEFDVRALELIYFYFDRLTSVGID